MLPAAARLTSGQDFGLVVRRGRRVGRPRLVIHALMPAAEREPDERGHSVKDQGETTSPTRGALSSPRVGFVVSKAVGGSVVRHRVARRLRHLMRDRLAGLPAGAALVVRALPSAATAASSELAVDLDSALRKLGGAR